MLDLTKDQMSPTASLLSSNGVAMGGTSTLPSQVPDSLEEEKEVPEVTNVTSEVPQEPQVTEETSLVEESPVVPEVTNIETPEETEEESELPTESSEIVSMEQQFSQAFSEDKEEVKDDWKGTGITIAPEVIDEVSMPNLNALGITNVDNRVKEDDWKGTGITIAPEIPKTPDEKEVDKHVNGILATANKIAYRGVRGVADTLDLISVPIWAITSTIGSTRNKPFASTLEDYYPEKNYIIEEDPDSYADDMLRIAGTGLEFAVGGITTTVAAKAGGLLAKESMPVVTQVIDDVTLKAETKLGFLSGVAYQTTLETTDSELAAFSTAILAPMASKPIETILGASWKGTKGAIKVTASPVTWTVNKVYNFSPAMQVINPKAQIASLKVALAANEKMWQGGFSGVARKLIEKIPENSEVSNAQKIEELESLRKWIETSIPKGDRVNLHVEKMKEMETSLNKWAADKDLGEFKLTLDQMFKPLVKELKDQEGLEELLEVGKLIGGEKYIEQVRSNSNILYKFLNDDAVPVNLKQASYFQDVFRAQSLELDELSQTIVDQAVGSNLFNKSSGAYDTAYESMPVVIEGLNKVKGIHQEAYGAWQKTLPDMDLDVTPIKNAFEEMAATTGIFDDPKNTPPYLKQMVSDLTSLGKKKSNRVKQLDASDDIDIQLKQLAKERRELQLAQAKELETTTGKKKELEIVHREALNLLDAKRTDLNTQKLELSKVKRDSKVAEEGVIDIPNPSFTSLEDVLKAHKILSDLKYASLKAGDDKYSTTIKPILDGVEETLEGLKEIDEKTYDTWRSFQDNYRKFVGLQMRESIAKKAIGPDGRTYKLSSGKAVDAFFENAKADEIESFLKIFDPEASDLDDWLSVIPEKTGVDEGGLSKILSKKGSEQFEDISAAAVSSYKDMVYSSLAREVANEAEGTLKLDPVKRLEAVDRVVLKWMQKNKDKLDILPDLEISPSNLSRARETMGKYIEMATLVEEQRKLSMFNNIQGPGITINTAIKDDIKAEQLADFLEDSLPQLPFQGKAEIGLETANNLRKLMYNSLIRENMVGNVLDYSSLEKTLTEGSTTRNNLIRILESGAVEKMDATVALHKAINESKVSLIEAINSDKVIKGLGKIGISLGRVGSLLQRRAVFQPSAGYLAGAAMTKLINISGKNQTSKTIQIFMDNPSALVEFDNILLAAKKELSSSKQARMDAVFSDPTRSIKELYPMLKDVYFGKAKGYFGYLGLKLTDEEIQGAIKEVFFPIEEEVPEEVTEEENKGN